ncbi:AraC family transcriptional regulator [Clostridium estertheticum]|uniref:AraC family transcriptional regulator n=1 Tax=Clostridium estertheticum TaxID=238834 RepID=UPI001C7CBAF6|nr:AraC family transcriptional regulator [Clostridium estertheticum]MBX4260967.1 AraC family transcriptional regulator [Clostridium estertheticum]WLC71811.1 AraC family transcriptional regulator [Clostridium estertheticum]
MKYYEFSLVKPLKYNLTGKFQAPSPEWLHFTRYMQDYELIIVTEGVAYLQVEHQLYSIGKGEFLIFPPSAKQAGYKKSSCSFYWLHFAYENPVSILLLEEFPSELPEDKIYIPTHGKVENLEKIIVIMKHLQDSVRSYHNSIQNNYVCTTILCEISSQFLAKKNQENSSLKRKQFFNDIQDYIKWNRTNAIKVSEIAEHFGYNKRYISSLFSTIANVSLKQYIMQEKIELAKYLLCDTNDNVSEIAYQLGYNDSHNFMKGFKKLVGLTPTQYRNAYSTRLLFYE